MCSAARSARGPALTDDISTFDVSTQANHGHIIKEANGQNGRVVYKRCSISFGFHFIERSPFSHKAIGNMSKSTDECIFLFSHMLK